jgi:hypothetical protein
LYLLPQWSRAALIGIQRKGDCFCSNQRFAGWAIQDSIELDDTRDCVLLCVQQIRLEKTHNGAHTDYGERQIRRILSSYVCMSDGNTHLKSYQ